MSQWLCLGVFQAHTVRERVGLLAEFYCDVFYRAKGPIIHMSAATKAVLKHKYVCLTALLYLSLLIWTWTM